MFYLFLAEGFEETEALATLDILRRGSVEASTVGVTGKFVTGAHKIKVEADIVCDELDISSIDGVILPGGIPGTPNLEKDETVQKAIDYSYKNGKYICAICAAPSILGHKGILKGKNATCFTGFEKELDGAILSDKKAVTDGKIITAVGAGASFDFGFEILAQLKGRETADKLKAAMKA